MKFELGAYSFGVAGKSPEGETVTTAQAVRNVLEQIQLAEQAGLDFTASGNTTRPRCRCPHRPP